LKLKSNKLKTPLFDTRLFTKNIELAYESIYQNYHEGLETKHIVI